MTAIPLDASEARQQVLPRVSNAEAALAEPQSPPVTRSATGRSPWMLRNPVAVDGALLLAMFFIVSTQASIGTLPPAAVAVVAAAVTLGAARWRGVYTVAAADSKTIARQRCASALGMCIGLFLLVAYTTDVALDRSWLPLAAAGATGVLALHRLLVVKLVANPRNFPALTTRLALLGDAQAIAEFDGIEDQDPRSVVAQRMYLDTSDNIRPALRQADQLVGMVHRGEIDRVVVLATAPGIPVVNAVVRRCSMRGVSVDLLTGATRVRPSRLDVGRIHGYSTMHIRPGLQGRGRVATKRLFDIVISVVALIIASPLMVAAALAVKLGSSGSVFYKQERLGRDGKQFRMIKFRSMLQNADQMVHELAAENEADGPLFKMKNDPRVTRVGGFMRRTSIDELPQLWNVLRGQMSLVGPRPALASEADGWPIELFDRLEAAPGITGLWQVSGRSNASFAEYERLDLYYVDNWTIGLDISILLRTIPALLGRGAY